MADLTKVEYESYGVSEFRLKLSEIVGRVARGARRALVRRRFDMAAVLVSIEDFDRISGELAATEVSAESIRSIREAREGFAGFIDRVRMNRARFAIHQRGIALAALVPVDDLRRLDPETHARLVMPGFAGAPPVTLAAATSVAPSAAPLGEAVQETEIINAAELRDQSGQQCLTEGVLTLRSRAGRRYLSGVFASALPAAKIMFKVRRRFVSDFGRVANRPNFYDVGEAEVDPDVTATDVQLFRLA